MGVLKGLVNHRRNWFINKAGELLLACHRRYENMDYVMKTNGELWLIDKLIGSLNNKAPVALDIGANVGDWSSYAAGRSPKVSVHAFEAIKETHEKLCSNLEGLSNVRINNVGASNQEGVIEMFYSEGGDGSASAIEKFAKNFRPDIELKKVEISTTTIDRYCEKNKIEAVNLLKIDVEGYEMNVLEGAKRMIENGLIDAIQFEYGWVNIETKVLLKDYYNFFERYNMRVGKLYPNYVGFKKYEYTDENFYGANFVACKEELVGGLK